MLTNNKTVCMVFPPKEKSKTVASPFPCFRIKNMELKFVDKFKYLGHMISNDERDDQMCSEKFVVCSQELIF